MAMIFSGHTVHTAAVLLFTGVNAILVGWGTHYASSKGVGGAFHSFPCAPLGW